jgi:hypothetical protein
MLVGAAYLLLCRPTLSSYISNLQDQLWANQTLRESKNNYFAYSVASVSFASLKAFLRFSQLSHLPQCLGPLP